MRRLGGAFALGGLFLLGLAAGLASVVVHRSLPGMLLAATAVLTAQWALRQWYRRSAAVFAAGWVAPLVVALLGRPEGDYAVGNDLAGYLLIGTGFLVAAVGITSLGGRDASTSPPST